MTRMLCIKRSNTSEEDTKGDTITYRAWQYLILIRILSGGRTEFDSATLRELVTRPCSDGDITATRRLLGYYPDYACDRKNNTMYHSMQVASQQTHSPFFSIRLDSTCWVKTITVVNVHTGTFCIKHPKLCTDRINGAKVEVLTEGK